MSIGETPAPNDPPPINRGANLCVVRALRSDVLALDVQKLDGSKRFGPCTYPLGPRNGRGRTSLKPLKVKVVFSGCPVLNQKIRGL